VPGKLGSNQPHPEYDDHNSTVGDGTAYVHTSPLRIHGKHDQLEPRLNWA
jgi:hypothetical protein